MAHTLVLYDGVAGTSIDLAVASGSGVSLMSYPYLTPPALEERQTWSLYTDGEQPYHARRINLSEEIIVEVQGSTADDLWARIRALEVALEHARDYQMNPHTQPTVYLAYKPHGSTNTMYSGIIDGRVDAPKLVVTLPGQEVDGAESEILAHRLAGVKILITREPFWRSLPPARSATITAWAESKLSATAFGTYGQIALTGVGGDIPALCRLEVTSAAAAVSELIVGLSSYNRKGARDYPRYAYFVADAGDLGYDTTITTDATALGEPDALTYPSGTKKRLTCTFATVATSAARVYYNIGATGALYFLRGTFRMMLRAKMASALTSATVILKAQTSNDGAFSARKGVTITGQPITVDSANWEWYDGGVVDTETTMATLRALWSGAGEKDYGLAGLYVYAAGTAGSNLYIDGIVLVPADEYYLYASTLAADIYADSTHRIVFDNCGIIPTGLGLQDDTLYSNLQLIDGRGWLLIPPGDSYLSILASYKGESDTSKSYALNLYIVQRYLSPRGAT